MRRIVNAVDGESDTNYAMASERFVEFQDNLNLLVNHIKEFKQKMAEAADRATMIAEDFGRLSQGLDATAEPWAATASKQAFTLKSMLEDSVETMKVYLGAELQERVMDRMEEQTKTYPEAKKSMKQVRVWRVTTCGVAHTHRREARACYLRCACLVRSGTT